jgi:hypothetical protein
VVEFSYKLTALPPLVVVGLAYSVCSYCVGYSAATHGDAVMWVRVLDARFVRGSTQAKDTLFPRFDGTSTHKHLLINLEGWKVLGYRGC